MLAKFRAYLAAVFLPWCGDTLLRAVKTGAQTAVALAFAGQTGTLTGIDWPTIGNVAGYAALASVANNLAGLSVQRAASAQALVTTPYANGDVTPADLARKAAHVGGQGVTTADVEDLDAPDGPDDAATALADQ